MQTVSNNCAKRSKRFPFNKFKNVAVFTQNLIKGKLKENWLLYASPYKHKLNSATIIGCCFEARTKLLSMRNLYSIYLFALFITCGTTQYINAQKETERAGGFF